MNRVKTTALIEIGLSKYPRQGTRMPARWRRNKGKMSRGKKILIGIGVAVATLAIAGIAVHQSRKGVVTVQTGKVARQDLASIVSASGEIRPKTYVNIGANAFGKITRLYVKEGDRVKKGQLLAQLENVQPSADVNATEASVEAAVTDSAAAAR
jgi:HlyD family secretion protein